jgi:cytochrome d ubiquinol oxidase subunit II
VLKCEGELRDWAYARIPWLAAAVIAVLLAAVALTLEQSAVARGHWAERSFGAAFPALGVLALLGLGLGVWRRRDWIPFAAAVLFFLAAYATLGVAFWPYMIPYQVTVASAAAPDASLAFLFWGAGLFVLPVIAVYTLGVYWIFRGKLRSTR